jgi:uncharacterized protein (DUF1015 family)
MARVRPFAAVRYRHAGHDITPLIAPPYDVVSAEERAVLLAGNTHNVVALELPDGSTDPSDPGNRYGVSAATWNEWRAEGILGTDSTPSYYVLEQRYELNGIPVRRKALIAEVGLEPFSAGVVLPHERTLPKALGDRYELIKATGANFSQVFGLFDDAAGETDALYARALALEPAVIATDADGVQSLVWIVSDPTLVAGFTQVLADKRIFIADGHHRYTTALAYRDHRRELALSTGTPAEEDPAYDYVMMALVNMEDPDLIVLPTHRVAQGAGEFDAAAFTAALAADFTVEPLPESEVPYALDLAETPTFLARLRGDDRTWKVALRETVDLDTRIDLDRSSAWKHLDVAVLQELILDPLLGIHPDRPETLDRLGFVKDARKALASNAENDAVFVMRATRMDQLRAVALSGETMPQKSTYFYPKMLSGIVMRAAD